MPERLLGLSFSFLQVNELGPQRSKGTCPSFHGMGVLECLWSPEVLTLRPLICQQEPQHQRWVSIRSAEGAGLVIPQPGGGDQKSPPPRVTWGYDGGLRWQGAPFSTPY